VGITRQYNRTQGSKSDQLLEKQYRFCTAWNNFYPLWTKYQLWWPSKIWKAEFGAQSTSESSVIFVVLGSKPGRSGFGLTYLRWGSCWSCRMTTIRGSSPARSCPRAGWCWNWLETWRAAVLNCEPCWHCRETFPAVLKRVPGKLAQQLIPARATALIRCLSKFQNNWSFWPVQLPKTLVAGGSKTKATDSNQVQALLEWNDLFYSTVIFSRLISSAVVTSRSLTLSYFHFFA